MATFGVFHNGSTNLPLKRTEGAGEKGILVPDATVHEVLQANRQVIRDQVRQGVLADDLGYDRFTNTEHHFQISGAEFSPNPLMLQMAIASRTEDIKFLQLANILPWHDPVRLAEQVAMLDIVSDGRVQVGVGRGYQPRENETLGQHWGGTIQDQERNRVVFEEKFDILQQALSTDVDLLDYDGEYHTYPPRHAKHHHEQERVFLEDEGTEYEVEDMLEWRDEGDAYSDLWNPVVSGGTTLNALPVTPKPVQEPLPVFWTPATSTRSIAWAARNGVNEYLLIGSDEAVEQTVGHYFEVAEEAGWPDPRPEYDGEPFDYGWDDERQRGVGTYKPTFNTDAHGEDVLERWKDGLEHMWDYYGPFGFVEAAFDEEDIYEGGYVDGDTIVQSDLALVGDSEHIVEQVANLFESAGFEGASFDFYFEKSGITGEEAETQMRVTAERVLPYLREEFEH